MKKQKPLIVKNNFKFRCRKLSRNDIGNDREVYEKTFADLSLRRFAMKRIKTMGLIRTVKFFLCSFSGKRNKNVSFENVTGIKTILNCQMNKS